MKKQLISKLTVLTLLGTITSSALLPSLTAGATTVSSMHEYNTSIDDIKILGEYLIEVDGIEYDLKEIANSIKADIDYSIDYTDDSERSAATTAIKAALKWVKGNWTKIYNKIPSWAKKYFVFDRFISIADQFIGISDGIQDFFNRVFRAMGMPESVNWAITNVIMLLLPF